MPSGKFHTRFNILLGLPIALVFLLAQEYGLSVIVAFGISFLYNAWFFNPDLDLSNFNKPNSLKGLLILPFLPYAWFFKHRGISHHFFWGTITRILYLAFIASFMIFCYLLVIKFFQEGIWVESIGEIAHQMGQYLNDWNYFQNKMQVHFKTILAAVIALFYGDLLHLTLDKLGR